MRLSDFETLIYGHLESFNPSNALIFANENGTRPPLPYLTMNVTPGNQTGQPHYSKADGTGNQDIKYNVDYSVSVQGYGVGSNVLLENIQEGLYKQLANEFRQINGLGLRSDNTISDITTLLGETQEKRYSLDLIFGTMRLIIDSPNYVENITGTGNVSGIDIDL